MKQGIGYSCMIRASVFLIINRFPFQGNLISCSAILVLRLPTKVVYIYWSDMHKDDHSEHKIKYYSSRNVLFKRTRNLGQICCWKYFYVRYCSCSALPLTMHTKGRCAIPFKSFGNKDTWRKYDCMHTFKDHAPPWKMETTTDAVQWTLLYSMSEGKWDFLVWYVLEMTHWAETSNFKVLDIWFCSTKILIEQSNDF